MILSKYLIRCQDTIACYLKIFIILYADDTVILSESVEGLQEALSAFEKYCNILKLTVNTNKSKIVVLSKKKYKTNVVFKICGQVIALQDSYSYLGVIFNYNGNFCTARKKLLDHVFDSLITPIFVYSCEVWGFENKQGIEKMHLQYCKRIINLRTSTPNFMATVKLAVFLLKLLLS